LYGWLEPHVNTGPRRAQMPWRPPFSVTTTRSVMWQDRGNKKHPPKATGERHATRLSLGGLQMRSAQFGQREAGISFKAAGQTTMFGASVPASARHLHEPVADAKAVKLSRNGNRERSADAIGVRA